MSEETAPIVVVEEAYTILQHLGGRGFLLMTGAHNLFAAGCSESNPLPWLRMDLQPNQAGVNRLKITVSATDNYRLDFYHQELVDFKPVITNEQVFEEVGVENLAQTFREVTGYETRMPRIIRIG
ncbi:hypothetical protein GKZ68_20805 (plasmid) [Hymenobacter sp. BRD128]|uniref:hypothetical protein n=1 Tax=Hymenobacter sp. BRD128 TaxID=2675878 RepID=UPI0015679829|nr:hypothetical protein [Hymenobacter sp. BRD128]QKG59124.1 hypothetical protein GKZ68_20805 [Hymenobacter sp. BRD128]